MRLISDPTNSIRLIKMKIEKTYFGHLKIIIIKRKEDRLT